MRSPSASTIAAALSAVFAGASWLVARDARKSANKSVEIEADRRHAELEPQFSLELSRKNASVTIMRIELMGPIALQELDKITVVIRDGKRKPHDPDLGLIPPNLENQIWSPYRFCLNVDDASEDGRTNSYPAISIRESTQFQLEPNPVPLGVAPQWWKETVMNMNFKLWVICEKDGYKSWRIPLSTR